MLLSQQHHRTFPTDIYKNTESIVLCLFPLMKKCLRCDHKEHTMAYWTGQVLLLAKIDIKFVVVVGFNESRVEFVCIM